MKDLKMVDLFGQYQKIKTEIDTAIHEVVDSSAFINGPQVKSFKKNLAQFYRELLERKILLDKGMIQFGNFKNMVTEM